MGHNDVIPNIHLRKHWQIRVKTWFDQAGRKKRRRIHRAAKAVGMFPNPTHWLRPAVHGQTNKYNRKIRLGRGFTTKELNAAGVKSPLYARSIGIALDRRRKDTCNETLNANVTRLKEYLNKIILYPRRNKYDKNKELVVKEAQKERLSHPDAKFQNTTKTVLPLPKPESAISFISITKEMKGLEAYKTLRKEWKTQKGVYKRLEAAKKKKLEKQGKKGAA